MARKVALVFDKLTLDKEVCDLVKRVGHLDSPGSFIANFTIEREPGGVTWVTVKFIADGEFCTIGNEEKAEGE